ncbi:MAG: DUF3300 domain-containing protein [Rhodospirillaceae bacterium]
MASAPAAEMSAERLETLVGRIALYPDDLVAIVLPASTNPLQVVQADRFLDKRKSDPALPVDERWDDAVKTLLNYPTVVKSMSEDLDWTSALGDAVVRDQAAVLEAIQAFRRRVQAAGNLKSDPKQVVVVEKEVIRIAPADPQVIYVPQYVPTTVVVAGSYSAWTYYPTPYPVYYYPYPRGAAFASGLIWGMAIGAAWGGNHYHLGFGRDAHINVVRRTDIDVDINRVNVNRPAARPARWQPNRSPSRTGAPVVRVGDPRPVTTAASRPAERTAAPAAANRPATRATGVPARPGEGGGAFSGYATGRQTQLDSMRGAASRQSMASGAAARPTGRKAAPDEAAPRRR